MAIRPAGANLLKCRDPSYVRDADNIGMFPYASALTMAPTFSISGHLSNGPLYVTLKRINPHSVSTTHGKSCALLYPSIELMLRTSRANGRLLFIKPRSIRPCQESYHSGLVFNI